MILCFFIISMFCSYVSCGNQHVFPKTTQGTNESKQSFDSIKSLSDFVDHFVAHHDKGSILSDLYTFRLDFRKKAQESNIPINPSDKAYMQKYETPLWIAESLYFERRYHDFEQKTKNKPLTKQEQQEQQDYDLFLNALQEQNKNYFEKFGDTPLLDKAFAYVNPFGNEIHILKFVNDFFKQSHNSSKSILENWYTFTEEFKKYAQKFNISTDPASKEYLRYEIPLLLAQDLYLNKAYDEFKKHLANKDVSEQQKDEPDNYKQLLDFVQDLKITYENQLDDHGLQYDPSRGVIAAYHEPKKDVIVEEHPVEDHPFVNVNQFGNENHILKFVDDFLKQSHNSSGSILENLYTFTEEFKKYAQKFNISTDPSSKDYLYYEVPLLLAQDLYISKAYDEFRNHIGNKDLSEQQEDEIDKYNKLFDFVRELKITYKNQLNNHRLQYDPNRGVIVADHEPIKDAILEKPDVLPEKHQAFLSRFHNYIAESLNNIRTRVSKATHLEHLEAGFI